MHTEVGWAITENNKQIRERSVFSPVQWSRPPHISDHHWGHRSQFKQAKCHALNIFIDIYYYNMIHCFTRDAQTVTDKDMKKQVRRNRSEILVLVGLHMHAHHMSIQLNPKLNIQMKLSMVTVVHSGSDNRRHI